MGPGPLFVQALGLKGSRQEPVPTPLGPSPPGTDMVVVTGPMPDIPEDEGHQPLASFEQERERSPMVTLASAWWYESVSQRPSGSVEVRERALPNNNFPHAGWAGQPGWLQTSPSQPRGGPHTRQPLPLAKIPAAEGRSKDAGQELLISRERIPGWRDHPLLQALCLAPHSSASRHLPTPRVSTWAVAGKGFPTSALLGEGVCPAERL